MATTESLQPMHFQSVATVDALSEGGALAIEVDGRQIVLVRDADQIYALDNLCPHAGSQLERGRIIGGLIICPLHGAKFNLTDGTCRNPSIGGTRPIITHHVSVVDGRIEIAISNIPITTPL